VVICGGGLAGCTLALQLRREQPGLRIAVVEPTTRPLPDACHKVGESSVEVGTHYLADVVGLRPYLDAHHLPKNGLRFFSGPAGAPLSERTELGPSESPIVPSYQMDRGRLENDLRGMVEDAGATLIEGWRVRDLALGGSNPAGRGDRGAGNDGGADHRIDLVPAGTRRGTAGTVADASGAPSPWTISSRWVVDATGRRRLLQRKLGHARPNGNHQSAVWFRVPGLLKVGQLVPPDRAPAWHARDIDGNRWLSTVHLTGAGYWVWLIPLATGFTSIGIVADPAHHPAARFGTPEAARDWLRAHEPELAAHLDEHDVPFADFRRLDGYSYGSARCFSADRWACVGEAGLFVDPLYSPGSDFIGLSNCLTAELIREDAATGAPDPERVALYDELYRTWADQLVRTLSGNGRVFPEHDVFGAKLWWDYYVYWSFMAPYFFRRCYRMPVDQLRAFHRVGERYNALNDRAQRLFEAWAELKVQTLSPGRAFTPLPMFPSVLADQHLELLEKRSPEDTLARVEGDLTATEDLLSELLLLALRGVGPDRARTLVERVGIDDGAFRPSTERVAIDRLPRRERLRRLSPLARDLERALGRWSREAGDLAPSLASAGLAPHPTVPENPRRSEGMG